VPAFSRFSISCRSGRNQTGVTPFWALGPFLPLSHGKTWIIKTFNGELSASPLHLLFFFSFSGLWSVEAARTTILVPPKRGRLFQWRFYVRFHVFFRLHFVPPPCPKFSNKGLSFCQGRVARQVLVPTPCRQLRHLVSPGLPFLPCLLEKKQFPDGPPPCRANGNLSYQAGGGHALSFLAFKNSSGVPLNIPFLTEGFRDMLPPLVTLFPPYPFF